MELESYILPGDMAAIGIMKYQRAVVACCHNGSCSPRPQYATNSSCINYSLRWLIVQQNKAIAGPILAERTGVNRSIVARCGAVGDGGLLQKLV